jgi:hypothetical protein
MLPMAANRPPWSRQVAFPKAVPRTVPWQNFTTMVAPGTFLPFVATTNNDCLWEPKAVILFAVLCFRLLV